MAEISEPRAFCYRCHKPELTCICGDVPRIDNRTHVRVLQHPRERFHPIGTARIARLGLANVAVEVADDPRRHQPAALPADAGLLFPGDEARELDSLASSERPSALVVVDGTWAQARGLVRDNPWLRRLPRYRLRPPASNYRIRREPTAEAVSTIEAIVAALRILEPDTAGLPRLLSSFDAMIDRQLGLIAERAAGKRRPAARRARRGSSGVLVDEPERLVLVAGEPAPRAPGGERQILQWAALRVASGERFERFVGPEPSRFPSPPHLAYMGLTPSVVAAGGTLPALRDAWRAFLRPRDVVVSWSEGALSLLSTVAAPPQTIQLKSLLRSRFPRASGPPEAISEALGLAVAPPAFRGRVGHALAHLAAILAHLRQSLAARDRGRGPRSGCVPPPRAFT